MVMMSQRGHRYIKVEEEPIRKVSWEDDAERLILYVDIMGFSYRVTKNDHLDLKRDLQVFKTKWERRVKPLQIGDHLRWVQFSDSILLVVNGTTEKMFNLITKAAVCLMQSAISLSFPIKGVLAQGVFTYDKESELYFGLPLVSAYQLHDEIYYYGIVVHHSAEQTVKSFANSARRYTKSKVYLKKGKTSHYHLAWHLLDKTLQPSNIKDSVDEWLDKIEESVSGAPRIYVDNTRDVVNNDKAPWETLGEVGSLE